MSTLRGRRQLVAQSSLGRRGSSDSVSSMEQEDRLGQEGTTNLSSVMQSERALQEFLQASAVGSPDDHLVEFAETLRTVARALKSVSEGKACALEEAAEWKRKYELERLRHLQQSNIDQNLHPVDDKEFFKSSVKDETNEAKGRKTAEEQNGYCSGKADICTQAMIINRFASLGASNSNTEGDSKVPCGKASFSLAWGTASEKSRRHKHDVVSFESGDITTRGRSSKQIILEWDSPPQSVVILSKPNSVPVQFLCKEMIRWLKEEKGITIYVEPRVKKELSTDTGYFSFVQSWESDNEVLDLHKKVDLVITLGGDGTVLWAASIFKGPVPPVVSFAMGSLGFMTPFQSEHYKDCLQMVMKGPVSITLRHRLQCRILQAPENESVDPQEKPAEEIHLVLNEVSIDRGASSFLTNLECYCDNFFVTCVQGDGLILSTTSGSTAYSLAAGGSMVHPQVPGILFTPICPHSLSFRPLILPEYVTIRVQVPLNSRGQAWASFDGKDRRQLKAGDALLCSMSLWPVPTTCESESTHDFLRSVREGLHWNLRKLQSLDVHEMGLSKFGEL